MPKPVISHNLYIHLNIKMRQALEHKNRILSMRLDYSRTTFRLRMLRFDTLDDRQDRCLLDNYSIRRCLGYAFIQIKVCRAGNCKVVPE